MQKKQFLDEERMWSMQQEHLRRQQVLADRAHKRSLRDMANAGRAT